MSKRELLTYLSHELFLYNHIRDNTKHNKKEYIKGLMKAARFFDVSFEELKLIVEHNKVENKLTINERDDFYIPTYIRKNNSIEDFGYDEIDNIKF